MKSTPEKYVILVVDDNPGNLGVVFEYLSQSGFEVMIEESGEEAIRRVINYRPDIILLDILMPGIDGYETCRRLKENNSTKDIPVIFMTAIDEITHEIKGLELGAVDYITKPFKQEILQARIKTHLEIQKQRKELAELNKKLNEVNAAKDKFFSIIAHDIKNSYASILTGFEILSKEEILKYLQHADKFIDNILEWGRIQMGTIKPKPVEFDIRASVFSVIKQVEKVAEKKNIKLYHSDMIEEFVYADIKMTEIILYNLLFNAIKFTNIGGEIKISLKKLNEYLEISVSDTGIGIRDEYLQNLFKIENKHQKHGTLGETGTGVGLILCRELVEMNGGKIWGKSEFGKGSIFYFTLPKIKS
ncbi:MAG: hybrid sensor histidine kinase/response regulator [Desulfobacterales bacterium]|nr:hybrid sensor histidine kinase/response regulator [Desulfobacterales bacterium]